MQFCTVSVAIRGSANHVVTNKEVTVPEIKILQHLHGGPDTVRDIRPIRFEKEFSHDEERQRLRQLYERGNGNGDEVHGLVGRLFGAYGKLPTTLTAIGYDPRQLAAAKRAAAEQALEDAKAIEAAEGSEDDGLSDAEREAIRALEQRESEDPNPPGGDDEGGGEDDDLS